MIDYEYVSSNSGLNISCRSFYLVFWNVNLSLREKH